MNSNIQINNTQDKQYLALELTKLNCINMKGHPPMSYIFNIYEYNLKRLCDLLDETDTILYLKSELEKVQKKNSEINSITRPSDEKIVDEISMILEEGKGDMEPYLYNLISDKIRVYKDS